MSFWGELKRRNVVKVGAAYLIVAWLVVQVVAAIDRPLGLPEWFDTAVIVLLGLGFAVVLLFTWIFELTPEGLKKTADVPLEQSVARSTGQRLDYVVIGLLTVAVAFLIIDDYVPVAPEEAASDTAPAGGIVDEPQEPELEHAANSIAVIPFVNISSDSEQEYFVDGLSEELMNQLAQIDGLLITARTSAFAFKGTTETVDVIGERLGVRHVLEGSVRKAGNRILITAQLVNTTDGFHLWSDSYDRELNDIFAIQEDISREVATELKVTLGIEDDVGVIGGTENLEAYQLYLQALARGRSLFVEARESLRLIDRALELDPNFALAWARKAGFHLFLSLAGNPEPAWDAAERAARRAVELAPDSADARGALAGAATARGNWLEAEAAYRAALALGDPATGGGGYGLLQLTVGHLRDAREQLLRDRLRDPLNDATAAFVAAVEDSLGNADAASAEYARGRELFDIWIAGGFNLAITNMGNPEFVPVLPPPPPQQGPGSITGPFAVFGPFEPQVRSIAEQLVARWSDPAAALVVLRNAYPTLADRNSGAQGMQRLTLGAAAARFGDPELALTAFEDSIAWSPGQVYLIWRPVFRDMRQLPRFKTFVREMGLVDYWQEYGWPDLCRPLGGSDFECD
jgi:TolB-like protein